MKRRRPSRVLVSAAVLIGCSPVRERSTADEVTIEAAPPPPTQRSEPTPPIPQPLLVPGDSDLSNLLEELITDGLKLGKIEVVHNTDELLAAVAPGRTIILNGDEYRVPRKGLGRLGRTSQLTLIGGGRGIPRIVQTNLSDWVLTLDSVSDVALYNLELAFATPDELYTYEAGERSCCGTLLVRSSQRVRLRNVVVNAGGKSSLDLYDVDDLSVTDSVIGGNGYFARMAASSNIALVDTYFSGPYERKTRGFALERTQLALTRSEISAEGRVLFTLDPATKIAGKLRKGSKRSGRPAHASASTVRLHDSVLYQPLFAELASDPSRVSVSSTAVPELTDDERTEHAQTWMTGLGNGRACNCQRRQGPDGWTLATSCWATLEACEREAKAIQRGQEGVLAGSSPDECSMVYGTDPSDRAWSTFFAAGHEQSVAFGVCSTSEPSEPPPIPAASEPDAKRYAWHDLGTWNAKTPFRLGIRGAVDMVVSVPVETEAFVSRAPGYDRPLVVSRNDPILPPELRRHRAHLLTEEGMLTLGRWNSAKYVADERSWLVSHPLPDPLPPHAEIALSKHPSYEPSVRRPGDVETIHADDSVARAAEQRLAMVGHRPRRVFERAVHTMSGRFPGGATRVVAVHWKSFGDLFSPIYRRSSVFTVDAEDRPVQWICVVCHTAWLRFAADLDGDGFDEVGWTDVFSWEERSHSVTHLSETVVETRLLSTTP